MILEIGLIADIQYGDIPDENNVKFFRAGLEQVSSSLIFLLFFQDSISISRNFWWKQLQYNNENSFYSRPAVL